MPCALGSCAQGGSAGLIISSAVKTVEKSESERGKAGADAKAARVRKQIDDFKDAQAAKGYNKEVLFQGGQWAFREKKAPTDVKKQDGVDNEALILGVLDIIESSAHCRNHIAITSQSHSNHIVITK